MIITPKRKYDVVVWGATGFTGKLVCQYLAEHAPTELQWTISGRNSSKLAEVAEMICQINSSKNIKESAFLVGDGQDAAFLDSMTSQTRVILSVVGPYWTYGKELIASCVRNHTDYVDLTGESHFIRHVMDTYHRTAVQHEGPLIVPGCGFEFIISDLSVYLCAQYAKSSYNANLGDVKGTIYAIKGQMSGGTLASMLETLRLPRELRMAPMTDPYYFCPEEVEKHENARFSPWCYYDEDFKCYQGYFAFNTGNELTVRRSSALREKSQYGPNFRYSEGMSMSFFLLAWLVSYIPFFFLKFSSKPIVWFLSKVLPKPGEGPSKEAMRNGYFDLQYIAEPDPKQMGSRTLPKIKARCYVQGDPGYSQTAKMISESAIALALQRDDLPCVKEGLRGGVLTPATAFGNVLVERLHNAGITFNVGTEENSW